MKTSRLLFALWLLVALVPLVYVCLGSWVFLAITNRAERFLEEPGIMLVQSFVVAVPFLILAWYATTMRAILSNRDIARLRIPASVGLILTFIFWVLYYYDGYTYWRDEARTGVNIGLGLLMIASPIIVAIGMVIGHRLGAILRRSGDTRTDGDIA